MGSKKAVDCPWAMVIIAGGTGSKIFVGSDLLFGWCDMCPKFAEESMIVAEITHGDVSTMREVRVFFFVWLVEFTPKFSVEILASAWMAYSRFRRW